MLMGAACCTCYVSVTAWQRTEHTMRPKLLLLLLLL